MKKRILAITVCVLILFSIFSTALSATDADTVVNVKDFGAVGDGKTDDREAIHRAFDYAIDNLPATVYFPEGEYGLSFNALYILMPHGSGGLTVMGDGADKSTIVYLENWSATGGEWVALRIMPELPETAKSPSDYSALELSDYLHDITIKDLGVYDTDPISHARPVDQSSSTIEETHGFNIKYCYNALITDCLVTNVGDEAFDMSYCIDSKMTRNTVIGSPAAGSGGGAISVGDGSRNVVISDNTVNGTTPNKTNFGIATEVLTDSIYDITIENNRIIGVNGNGVNIGTPGNAIYNVTVRNNYVENCTNGLATSCEDTKEGVVFTDNYVKNCDTGILMLGYATETLFDSCIVDGSRELAMRVGGTSTLVKNCTFTNSAKRVIYFSGTDSKIQNCTIDECGFEDDSLAAIEQFVKATSAIDGLTMTNCHNLTAILGVDVINGASVTQTETQAHIAVKRVKKLTDSQFNRGIYATVKDSVIDSVNITMTAPVTKDGGIYVANVQGATVTNCTVISPSGYAIREAGNKNAGNKVVGNFVFGGASIKSLAADSVFEKNITCKLNGDTLTVSGNGKMKDFGAKTAPWYSCATQIKNVVIEDGITHIGKWSFAYCYNLENVSLPSTLETIDSNAFYACSKLSDITIPENVTNIGVGAFYKCAKLESINIPAGITKINKSVFSGCNSLKTVCFDGGESALESITIAEYKPLESARIIFEKIPMTWSFDGETLTISGDGEMDDFTAKTAPWYEYSTRIKNVVIENGITHIGKWSFAYCYNLENVSLPSTLETIGSNAFYACSKLKNITLPENVGKIDVGTFYKCSKLESITIPKSVKTVNGYAFYGCKNLKTATYGAELENLSVKASGNEYLVIALG